MAKDILQNEFEASDQEEEYTVKVRRNNESTL